MGEQFLFLVAIDMLLLYSTTIILIWFGWLVYGVYCHFQQYFSYLSWRSVLLVEEAESPRENHRSVANHWQILIWISSWGKKEKRKYRIQPKYHFYSCFTMLHPVCFICLPKWSLQCTILHFVAIMYKIHFSLR